MTVVKNTPTLTFTIPAVLLSVGFAVLFAEPPVELPPVELPLVELPPVEPPVELPPEVLVLFVVVLFPPVVA